MFRVYLIASRSNFVIWLKKDIPRNPIIIEEPNGYIFVKKDNNPDISIRRVKFYSGKIDTDIKSKNIQTHYFITFTNNSSLSINLYKLQNIIFENDNTVGPKSISKQDIIKRFNKLLQS
jgi:hypothetical protein